MSIVLSAPTCIGTSGEFVRSLQQALNNQRIAPLLMVDGRFGMRTDRNVRAFQKQKGLKADGVVGSNTSRALGWSYTGHAARPYTIRMEPPLPATTPPLYLIADAILHTMSRYHSAITDEIRNSGAPKEWIDNAVNGLSVPYEYLSERLAELKKDTSTPEWLEVYLGKDLAEYQIMVVQVGLYVKKHGGSTSRMARLVDGLQTSQITNAVLRFLKGEVSAAMTISNIDIHMSAVLGPMIPIPAP